MLGFINGCVYSIRLRLTRGTFHIVPRLLSKRHVSRPELLEEPLSCFLAKAKSAPLTGHSYLLHYILVEISEISTGIPDRRY